MVEVVRGERRGQRWQRLAHGLHADGPCSPEDRLRAWELVLPPSAVWTHLSAAALRGWWLPADVPRPAVAAVARGERHPQRRGLVVLRLGEPPVAEQVRGFAVASAPETLLAAARDLAVLDLVPLADSALRTGDCSLAELTALGATGRPGAPALRRALPLLDPRSESAWESVMRVLHGAAGVAVDPQHVVRDADGRFVARADLQLVGTRRLHEYDGEVHRDRAVHRADLDRDRRLLDEGWQRYGWTAAEVLRGGALIASADAALGRSWDGRRLQAWRQLVADSWWGAAGRARAAARWADEC
ncbi:hypothetical protein ACFFOM_15765 [Microlunatus capsulatus]|uniref:Transcriptional regulator, AbiEi antitoxin, Type IV TA system n=1 Tax=Microlunatus capsulatus TaxID=99117 RepID=A0ABS4Z6W3_9ACTN|nr:hypothetical protein [Microlunatus capsulatus]MBP2416793.1 hypothetical protein [Microlunatus capsulatus]